MFQIIITLFKKPRYITQVLHGIGFFLTQINKERVEKILKKEEKGEENS